MGQTVSGQCRVRAPVIGFVTVEDEGRGGSIMLPNRFWLARLLIRLGLWFPRLDRRGRIERCTSFPITEEDANCGEWRKAKA